MYFYSNCIYDNANMLETDEIYMGGQEHFYMETQGVIAVPKGENGELDLFVASQHSAYAQVRYSFLFIS